jgi:hypothetical protein
MDIVWLRLGGMETVVSESASLFPLYAKRRPENKYQRPEKVLEWKAACKVIASRLPALCRGVAKALYSRGDVTGVGFDADGIAAR